MNKKSSFIDTSFTGRDGSIKTKKVGRVFIHIKRNKSLIQISDGFDRVTLTSEEFALAAEFNKLISQ